MSNDTRTVLLELTLAICLKIAVVFLGLTGYRKLIICDYVSL